MSNILFFSPLCFRGYCFATKILFENHKWRMARKKRNGINGAKAIDCILQNAQPQRHKMKNIKVLCKLLRSNPQYPPLLHMCWVHFKQPSPLGSPMTYNHTLSRKCFFIVCGESGNRALVGALYKMIDYKPSVFLWLVWGTWHIHLTFVMQCDYGPTERAFSSGFPASLLHQKLDNHCECSAGSPLIAL